MNMREGKLLLQAYCQLTHVEGMKKFKIYHLATTRVMSISSQSVNGYKNQWVNA